MSVTSNNQKESQMSQQKSSPHSTEKGLSEMKSQNQRRQAAAEARNQNKIEELADAKCQPNWIPQPEEYQTRENYCLDCFLHATDVYPIAYRPFIGMITKNVAQTLLMSQLAHLTKMATPRSGWTDTKTGNWYTYQTLEQLADQCGCTERQIRTAVKWLKQQGFIETRVRGRGYVPQLHWRICGGTCAQALEQAIEQLPEKKKAQVGAHAASANSRLVNVTGRRSALPRGSNSHSHESRSVG